MHVVIDHKPEPITGAVGEVGGKPVVGAGAAGVGVEAGQRGPAAIGPAGARSECGRLILDKVSVARAVGAGDARRGVGAHVIGDGHGVVVGGGVTPLIGITHAAAGGVHGVFGHAVVGAGIGAVARCVITGGAVGSGHGGLAARAGGRGGVDVGVGAGGVGAAAGDVAEHTRQSRESHVGHAALGVGGGVFGRERAARNQGAVKGGGAAHPGVIPTLGDGVERAGGRGGVHTDFAAGDRAGGGVVVHVVPHIELVLITVARREGVAIGGGQRAVPVHHGAVGPPGRTGRARQCAHAPVEPHRRARRSGHARKRVAAVGPGNGLAGDIGVVGGVVGGAEGVARGRGDVPRDGVVGGGRRAVARRVITGGPVGPADGPAAGRGCARAVNRVIGRNRIGLTSGDVGIGRTQSREVDGGEAVIVRAGVGGGEGPCGEHAVIHRAGHHVVVVGGFGDAAEGAGGRGGGVNFQCVGGRGIGHVAHVVVIAQPPLITVVGGQISDIHITAHRAGVGGEGGDI